MSRVKEVYMDKTQKAETILWDNGETEKIPFRVDESLEDHGGDRRSYWNYCMGLIEKYGQIVSRLRPNEPNPMDLQYPEGEYDERYKSDLRIWEQKKVLKDFQEENAPPPPQPRPSWPPDEHAAERKKWDLWKQEYLAKAQKAADDPYQKDDPIRGVRAHLERVKWGDQELATIPKPWGLVKYEEDDLKNLEGSVELLFDPKLKDDDIWNHPRMQHDAEISIHDYNKRSEGNTVIIPLERGKHTGNYLPVAPGNVKKVELDDAHKKDFQYLVYQCGQDPITVLRKMGFGQGLSEEEEVSQAESVETETSQEGTPESETETKHPLENLNQADFEKVMLERTGKAF